MEISGKIIQKLQELNGVSARGEWRRQDFIIEPDYDKVLSVFLVYALNSSEARRQVGGRVVGSTQHVLNTADLAKIKIANPSLNRQREFAAFVAEVDKSKFAVRKRLEKARQLYRAKLQEYFG